MKIIKFFAIALLIGGVLAVGYFGYPVIKKRYFSQDSGNVKSEQKMPENSPAQNSNSSPETPEPSQTPENAQEQQPTSTSQNQKINITQKNCDNECSGFKDSDLKYCQEICGLAAPQTTPSGTCDNLGGLDKDYCLKDLAVFKKDFKLCDQIQDSGIKKTCKNRVTEDLIEN